MLVARDLWLAPPGADSPAALRGISLSVGRGEWVAISGPNGSGKSTLAIALAGLVRPRRGSVELEGQFLGPGSGTRAKVAVVLQEASSQLLQPTVAEELGFAARNLGHPEAEVRRRIDDWSHRLGLAPDLSRDPRTLSAGRQQMVLLAAALISRPDLLVADEAGAHLDREGRALVLDLVRREVKRGLTVVWVTQEPAEQAAADRIFLLENSGAEAAGSENGSRSFGVAEPGPPSTSEAEPQTLMEICVSPRDGFVGPGISTDGSLMIRIGTHGVWALEGRNGAGKTVLLEAVAGLRRLSQVTLAWGGEPRCPPILASQSPELQHFEERVVDEVTYSAVKRGLDSKEARDRAVAHFEALALGGRRFLERRSWDLSAGESRLMHLVAALIAPASLVLLDEPTCGLDRARREALAGLVERRSKTDPVLVATQDSDWITNVKAHRLMLGSRSSTSWQVPAKKTD